MNANKDTGGSDTSGYDVLGISHSASDKEIKTAYREQASTYHPDTCDHPDATELFEDVNQAKEELMGTKSRVHNLHGSPDYNYFWKDGTPKHPTTEEPNDSPSTGSDNGSQTGTDTHRNDSTDDQTGDDDPWKSGKNEDIDSSTPDPDPETVVMGGNEDEADESEAAQSRLTRREIAVMAGFGGGGLLIANQMGLFSLSGGGGVLSGAGELTGSKEFVSVGPEESLQDGINRTAPNGTVELKSGRYFESITIDKNLTIKAPNGAILDGQNADRASGIRIEAQDTTISNIEIIEYDGPGVLAPDFTKQTSLVNLDVSNVGGHGIAVGGESITIESTTVQDCGDTGILIVGTQGGTVEIEDVLVERSERVDPQFQDVQAQGRGINVVGGSDITIVDVEAVDNDGQNIRVGGGDARGQAIEITNSTVLNSGVGSNIVIEGTGREDEVLLEEIVTEDGGRRGAYIGANGGINSVVVRDIEAKDNGDTGLRIESTPEGTVEIEDILVERSQRVDPQFQDVQAQGRGINVVGGSDILVNGTDAIDNDYHNIRIGGGDARGQSIQITNSATNGSANGNGILTAGTDGQDDTTIQNVEANMNSEFGLDLGGDSITISDTTAENNDEGPYNFRETDKSNVTIQNGTNQ